MPRGYDAACFVLAEYFIGKESRREDVDALAQHIQDAIEDWLFSYSPAKEKQNGMGRKP